MMNKALEAFGDLGDDEELGPADWPTVKRYISSLNDVEGEQVHPHAQSQNDSELDPLNLKDIRLRFLNGKGFFSIFSFGCEIVYMLSQMIARASNFNAQES